MTYYQTDMLDDFIESIEESERQIQRIFNGGKTSKWIIISLHSALQAAMTLVLHQGNGLKTLDPKNFEKFLKNLDNDTYTPPRLDKFLNLYRKIKDPKYMCGIIDAKPFESSDFYDVNISHLNNLRNNFIHYSLDIWSIEKLLIENVIKSTISVIRFLVDSTLFPWHRALKGITTEEHEKSYEKIESTKNRINSIAEKINSEFL